MTDVLGLFDELQARAREAHGTRTGGPIRPPDLPSRGHELDGIDVGELLEARRRIGPGLAELRVQQQHAPPTQRESYSMEHVRRLFMYRPNHPYSRPRDGRLCSKTHPQPCPYGCRSCHFCRQRTVEPKTVCAACEGRNNFYGGPGRGYWCGSCLWLRVGENADEVRQLPGWNCPACRDICNCSGANCQRLKRGWFPTNQLAHEASTLGYASVAHYLILTHVGEQVAAAPMGSDAGATRVQISRVIDGEPLRAKKQKLLTLAPTRRQVLRDAAAPMLAALHTDIARELRRFQLADTDNSSSLHEHGEDGGETGTAGGFGEQGITWSSILDAGMEELEEGESSVSPLPLRNKLQTTLVSSALDKTRSLRRREMGGAKEQHSTTATITSDKNGGTSGADKSASPLGDHAPSGDNMLSIRSISVAGIDSRSGGESSLSRETLSGRGGSPKGYSSASSTVATSPPWLPYLPPHVPSRVALPLIPLRHQPAVPEPAQEKNGDPAMVSHLLQSNPSTTDASFHAGIPGSDLDARVLQRMHQQRRLNQNGGEPLKARQDLRRPSRSYRPRHPLVPRKGSGSRQLSGRQVHQRHSGTASTTHQERRSHAPLPAAPSGDVQIDIVDLSGEHLSIAGQQDPNALSAEFSFPTDPPSSDQQPNNHPATADQPRMNDEAAWNRLCVSAETQVLAVQDLYRFHPDNPAQERAIPGTDDDELRRMYTSMHDSCRHRLEEILEEATAMLAAPIEILLQKGGTPKNRRLYTHAGLRRALALLHYLACLLPSDVVENRILPYFLPSPEAATFNLQRADPLSRVIFLCELLSLIRTSLTRNLAVESLVMALAELLAILAEDLAASVPLLETMLEEESLPAAGMQIGSWTCDLAQTQVNLFSQLTSLHAATQKILQFGINKTLSLCRSQLGLLSGCLLTPRLLASLLSPGARLHKAIRLQGLSLLCQVLQTTQESLASGLLARMTGSQRTVYQATLERLYTNLMTAAVPALEGLLRIDYPLRRQKNGGPEQPTVIAEPPESEHIGSEKLEALARCLAFLLEAKRLSWHDVEACATQPHPPGLFWRLAGRMYRQLAGLLLGQTLQHAPRALEPSSAGTQAILRVWLLSFCEGSARVVPWYLTALLRALPATSSLFLAVDEAHLEVLQAGSTSGSRLDVLRPVLGSITQERKNMISGIIAGLDEVIAARTKEVSLTAFDPVIAAGKYALLTWPALHSVISMLQRSNTLFNPEPIIVRQRELLLNRLAGWIAEAGQTFVKNTRGYRRTVQDQEERALITARQTLRQETVWGQLCGFWSLVVQNNQQAVGGVHQNEHNNLLWHPIWTVVAACLELGRGFPEGMDCAERALYQEFAASLPVQEPITSYHQTTLAMELLSTFCVRNLGRVSIAHASAERGGINALHLAQEILGLPALWTGHWKNSEGLCSLARPLLEVLCPLQSRREAPAVQTAAFHFLISILRENADLLGYGRHVENEQGLLGDHQSSFSVFQSALEIFWEAVASAALRAVATCLPPSHVSACESKVRKKWSSDISQLCPSNTGTSPCEALLPATINSASAASNALLAVLPRPRPLDTIESLYAKYGSPIATLGAQKNNNMTEEAPPSKGPADGHWTRARASMVLIQEMVAAAVRAAQPAASLPLESTLLMSPGFRAFPAVHFLIAGAGAVGRPLASAYLGLRNTLERLPEGQTLLQAFALKKAGPQQQQVGDSESRDCSAEGSGENQQIHSVLSPSGDERAKSGETHTTAGLSDWKAGSVVPRLVGRLEGTPTSKEPLLGQLKRNLCNATTMVVDLGPVQAFKVVNGIKTYLSLPNTEAQLLPSEVVPADSVVARPTTASMVCSQMDEVGWDASSSHRGWSSRAAPGLSSQLTPDMPWADSHRSYVTDRMPTQTLTQSSATDKLKRALAFLARLGVAKEERLKIVKAVQQGNNGWREWTEDQFLVEIQSEVRARGL